MLLAFFIANTASSELFVARSTRFRPDLGNYLAGRVGRGYSTLSYLFIGRPTYTNIETTALNQIDSDLAETPLQALAPGVYAKENAKTTYIIVKEGEIEYQVYTFVIKDKTYTVRVPRGQNSPTQQSVEKIVK